MSVSAGKTGGRAPRGREITGPQVKASAGVGKIWRDRANWAVRGIGPPTVPIAVPGADDDVSQRHARMVLDLGLRIGEASLSTGASAAEVVATVLRVTSAYGVKSTAVDITYTSISVSVQRGVDQDPLSVMRVIKARALDFTRLEGLQRLVDDLTATDAQSSMPHGEPVWVRIPVEDARTRLADILTKPHPYRRWIVTLGMALTGLGVVILFDAGPTMWIVAGLSAAAVDLTQRALYRLGVASFFSQVASAAIPSTIAVVLYWVTLPTERQNRIPGLGIDVPGLGTPSLVVVSGIIVLLAGLSVMGAAQDALDGYYVTAGARGLEVATMTLGIAVGVAGVLAIANAIGLPLVIQPDVAQRPTVIGGTIGAMIVAVGFCMTNYTGIRATVASTGVAAVSWLTFQAGSALALPQAPASAVAATLVGALAYAIHHWLRVPEVVVGTAAIYCLLPGLAVYTAIFLLMLDSESFLNLAILQVLTALAVGLGLAGGLSIGGYAARRRFGLDVSAMRARRRALGAYQD
ncbi:MAG: threonine/serine exporter family protein [Ornithinimicrobium sp.]